MPREYQFGFGLRHLVTFREVARQLHFRKAAETLAVAQPALSRQIAQLEESLGVRLFVRSSRRVQLTPAGSLLLERVEPVLRTLSRIEGELRDADEGRTGLVRVAFTGLAMATVLPAILREFHAEHSGIRLALNEMPTVTQASALLAGELDCGFFHPEAAMPGIEVRQVLRERNGALLPAGHPLAGRHRLKLRDLADVPLVLFPRANNPAFFDQIIAAFSEAGITPQIAEEVWPRANGVGLVRAGVGATFLCPSEARQLPAEVVFRPLIGPAPESRLVVGWRASESKPTLEAFLGVALKHTHGGL
jgi:DNA-binding transcriptional LysR family regulator